MELTCIKCPIGCRVTIKENTSGDYEVSGNLCPLGKQYALEEMTAPKRIVTSLIRVNDKVYPCKTSTAIPKDKIFEVLEEIGKLKIFSANVGDVVVKNILNTDADIVITGTN